MFGFTSRFKKELTIPSAIGNAGKYLKANATGGVEFANLDLSTFQASKPTVTGPDSVVEGTSIILNIPNYNPLAAYTVTSSHGEVTVNASVITFTAPAVDTTTLCTIGVSCLMTGYFPSEFAQKEIYILDIESDDTVAFNNTTITPANFPALVGATITSGELISSSDSSVMESINIAQEANDEDWVANSLEIEVIGTNVLAGVTQSATTQYTNNLIPNGTKVIVDDAQNTVIASATTTTEIPALNFNVKWAYEWDSGKYYSEGTSYVKYADGMVIHDGKTYPTGGSVSMKTYQSGKWWYGTLYFDGRTSGANGSQTNPTYSYISGVPATSTRSTVSHVVTALSEPLVNTPSTMLVASLDPAVSIVSADAPSKNFVPTDQPTVTVNGTTISYKYPIKHTVGRLASVKLNNVGKGNKITNITLKLWKKI